MIIKGACSNQVVKCIIFTSDYEVGTKKLLKIEEEKKNNSIVAVDKRIYPSRPYLNEIRFSDGEEWIILKPNDTARGYRWRKAWIDVKSVTIYDLRAYILPLGDLYKWEDEKYFNW